MKTHPKPVPLISLNRLRSKINLSDDRFQRSAVWNLKQEQFLMDTIIREFDIPKVYFWDLQDDSSNYSYSVVDGQQRLTTIFRFFNNDNDRNFTEEQRLTIYRRDKSVCWHCNNHVDWKDFEADHRPNPWSKGGKTTVENGVCAHKSCNVKASNKDNLVKGWLIGESK